MNAYPLAVSSLAVADGRVLVVDDDETIRAYVHAVLEPTGYEVTSAEGIVEAMQVLGQVACDVVLIDLTLHDGNGLDLLDEVRSRAPHVVPIILSASKEVLTAVAGMRRGAIDFLAKPVNPETLLVTVDRAMTVARSRRRSRELEKIAWEWEALFDSLPIVLAVINSEGKIIRRNATAIRLFQDLQDDPFWHDLLRMMRSLAIRSIAGEVIPEQTIVDAVKDRRIVIRVSPIQSTDGTRPGAIIIGRDESDLARSESQRAKLLEQLFSAQEDERRRLAYELHDGIGQSLATLTMGLTAAVKEPDRTIQTTKFHQLVEVAREAMGETRRMARALRPAALDNLGLLEALSRMTEQFSQINGITADLIVPSRPTQRLPGDVESAVYRIVQEALSNVSKHADAKTVDVVLDVNAESLHVVICDDGRGIELPDSRIASGMGLNGMRERALLLGGTFRWESALNSGTTVDVRIPIRLPSEQGSQA